VARAKAVLETLDAPERERRSPFRGRGVRTDRRIRRGGRRGADRQVAPPSLERRYRQTIRKVDLWTVLKISICFYLTGLLVTLFAGVLLWWFASAVGIVENIEDFVEDLTSSTDFQFLSWDVLRGATLVGLVLVCFMVVCTVLAAAFYNLFAELLGGVEITVVEEDGAES
jgi:hypothetical protein